LIHVLKQFSLLFGKLASKNLFTLATEALHMLSFVFLEHLLDIYKARLSFLELALSVFKLGLDVLNLGLLFFFGVTLECIKISLSFDHRLVKVNSHLVFLVHALSKFAKHDDPLLSLSLLKQLHLFAVSLRLHQL